MVSGGKIGCVRMVNDYNCGLLAGIKNRPHTDVQLGIWFDVLQCPTVREYVGNKQKCD